MALHANRKKCENLIYGSVKTKQKRLDALARIEKEKRREADRSTDQLVYTDAPIDAAGCLAVEEKKRESDGHVNIRWSHFDYNLRSYNTMDEIAARHMSAVEDVLLHRAWFHDRSCRSRLGVHVRRCKQIRQGRRCTRIGFHHSLPTFEVSQQAPQHQIRSRWFQLVFRSDVLRVHYRGVNC